MPRQLLRKRPSARSATEVALPFAEGLAQLAPENDESLDLIRRARESLMGSRLTTLMPLLPVMLNLKGDPFTLVDHFPFEPFFNTHCPRNIVEKCGRQVAKCVRIGANQRVLLENGRRVAGEQLAVGDRILSLNSQWKTVVGRVTAVVRTPPRPVLRVTTRTGVVLDMATTHPLRKLWDWKHGHELRIGDRVCAIRRGGKFGRKQVPHDRILATAYLLGDGHVTRDIGITSDCRKVLREFQDIVQRQAGYRPAAVTKKDTTAKRVNSPSHAKAVIRQWLDEDGLYGKYAWEKSIPAWVYALSRANTVTFVERLWATDGMIRNRPTRPDISFCSTSRELAFDLRSLLLKFGIPTSICRKKAGYRNKKGRFVRCHDAYVLRVETQQGWQTFLKTFQVPGKPGFVLRDVVENNNRDTLPQEIQSLVNDLCKGVKCKHATSLRSSGLRVSLKHPPTYGKLKKYLRHFRKHCPKHPRLAELAALLEGDVLWDEIRAIEDIGKHPCWDIEVETEHNYVLDGVVSHNSTSAAAQGVIQSACLAYFNTLYITPLYEMIRRFSGNYVRGFIEQSPIKALFVDSSCYNNVLQRSFLSQSTMFFSFAFLDADRTRGLNTDKIHYDEYQDFDPSFPAIIRETMSGSKRWGFQQFTGTPKTLDGPLENEWLRSSQAEWCIKCMACGHWNIPSLAYDLEKMMGPLIVRREISEESPGCVCAKCARPVYPRTGRWVHANKELKYLYAGYHIPQIIMPMHYADREKWMILQGKRQGFGNTPINVFYNEVCGESYDTGAKLITITDLKRAASLPENGQIARVKTTLDDYIHRVLAVDWGGGGEDEISFTTVALCCMLPDGKIHVPYGWRSLTPHDHNLEAERILKLMLAFQCTHVVHDFNGAGDVRETLMINSGLDNRRSLPITYIRAANGPIMRRVPYNERTQQREHYRVDKNRSLQQLALLVKFQQVRFFAYDFLGAERPGLLHDFLSLVEDRVDSRTGLEIQTVIRNRQAGPDDFAQAVNMGVCALYHRAQHWPNLAEITRMQVPPEVMLRLEKGGSMMDDM